MCVEFPQTTPVRRISGSSVLGAHFSDLGDFLGEVRMAKVHMLDMFTRIVIF